MSPHDSTKFLSIHGSYNNLGVSLFCGKTVLESVSKLDARASVHLISVLDALLRNHNLTLTDLNFIAVDRGPGAFTSLRVTLATINGIGFDKKIKLIGVNGLEALVFQNLELIKNDVSIAIALLNAYNNDVYFLIASMLHTDIPNFTILDFGCSNIDQLIFRLKNDFSNHKIYFCGHGSELHKTLVVEKLAQQAIFSCGSLPFATPESIGILAYNFWQNNQNIVDQIEPLYLKTQHFAIRRSVI